MSEKEHISLLELLGRVKESIENRMGGSVWVKAQISEIKSNSTGHCYLELADAGEGNQNIEARAQAIIWSSVFKMLKPYFETTTGYQLSRGMNVLVKVQVQFSTLYGLSLIISDIDPSFTVGELEIERQKTIERLRREGMFEMNRTLQLPRLPHRFAIVSSESAAGYLDFIKHLHENEYGYRFYTKLFPAPVQGENAPAGIIGAIDKVASEIDSFDALLILRGGGGVHDLRCFDDYDLAVNIAQFPIPVLTGIGHEQDFHIADMVAHTSVKTPTALASFITGIFIQEDSMIASFASRLSLSLQTRVVLEQSMISRVADNIFNICNKRFSNEQHRLELAEERVKNGNPLAILDKGYALVARNGLRVTGEEISAGENLEIMMQKMVIDCKVEKVKRLK